jgi:hypothetical protein
MTNVVTCHNVKKTGRGLQGESLEGIDRTILTTLAKMLSLRSFACKESALHGSEPWHAARPDFVESAIDSKSSQIPGPLRQYAKNARAGSVQ